jgi:hypothetical protein
VAVDVHPQDRTRVRFGLVRAVGELDPTRLPAPTCEHLRLDDDLTAELLGGGARLLR